MRARAGASGTPRDGIVVFVHGFNTSFERAVYRHAQIANDYAFGGPLVTFSWPSMQRTVGHVRDKESVLFSRDHLDAVLTELTRTGQPVFIVGHSMETQLVVETLRQLSITGRKEVLAG